MEDHPGDSRSIKVITFNNRREDWTEFGLKFTAIADERGYDEIQEGIVSVPRDSDVSGGEESAQVKAGNKRGARDLILATKDTLLTMVASAKTDVLYKGDLCMAWKKLEKHGILSQQRTKLTHGQNSFNLRWTTSK